MPESPGFNSRMSYRRNRKFLGGLLLTASLLGLPSTGALASTSQTVTPIPVSPGSVPTVPYTGAAQPAGAAPRTGTPALTNPFLASSGGAQPHADGFSSDAHTVAGPTGKQPVV